MKKQTAGRNLLGALAPKFAELNDDVLFGEIWSREDKLSPRDRSMITISALFATGQYPQLKAHLALGKEHGIKKEEVVEIFTQLAFYCGWPRAWSAFPMIEEVYDGAAEQPSLALPIGEPNTAFARFCIGDVQRYVRTGVSQQLARSSRVEGRRSVARVRLRTRMVSGMGQRADRNAARRRREHTRERQTLAWRGKRHVVPAYRAGNSRRGDRQRMARPGKRRTIRQVNVVVRKELRANNLRIGELYENRRLDDCRVCGFALFIRE